MQLTENQAAAVALCERRMRVIITGGAGSGKTTVITSVIQALKTRNAEENIVLTAPTGKAAARVREATGHEASTLHSACGIFPADNSEDADDLGTTPHTPPAASATTLVVDEASMLDDRLLATAIGRVSPRCRVVLVGDPNQLPPVGAGYPFRDLVRCGKVPHIHLDKVHRQAGKLLENCYAVLNGEDEGLVIDPGKGLRVECPWGFIETPDDRIGAALEHLFTGDQCLTTFGVPAEELLTLVPINKGDCGRIELNRIIQRAYHTSRGRVAPEYKNAKGEYEADKFVVGDRVIWTVNDRAIGLVNGDTGVVRELGAKTAIVEWDGIGRKSVDLSSSLQLAWVLTCHKAQGSQYRKVLVIQAGKHSNKYLDGIVNRSWVYTAATRAKEATWFIGSSKAFRKHIATPAVDQRRTVLETIL